MQLAEFARMLSGAVVVGFGLFLIGLAAVIIAMPSRADGFLRGFASSALTHYTEQGVRLVVGAAIVIFANSMRYPEVFTLFGWVIIASTTALLLIPWRWHNRFATFVMPPVLRRMWLLAFGAFALGSFVLYSVFVLWGTEAVAAAAPQRDEPSHYVFFAHERGRISEQSFLETPQIVGAQLKYTWRQLEPERDRYNLQPILDDLAFLDTRGKRLFVQLQDVSFSEEVLVPDYLRRDPEFRGGASRKYEYEGIDESKAVFDGWVARRWDPAVRARFAKLLDAMGQALDGRIEGLNLAETSIGFGDSGKRHPEGFTYEGYVEGVKETMTAARSAFPKSVVIQYANFMPGEWLPSSDKGYLRSIYAHAARSGVGVGGPDLLPHRRGQQNHSHPLIAGRSPGVRAGVAVQDGNLAETNPATGKRVTTAELYRFAVDRLRLDYIFWGTEEPYYSTEVVPFIRGGAGR